MGGVVYSMLCTCLIKCALQQGTMSAVQLGIQSSHVHSRSNEGLRFGLS